MIRLIKSYDKKIAKILLGIFAVNFISTNVSYALTSGPTQPEVQSFTPYSANDMVDLFSGNFSYNIPLLEIPGPNGGYPVNLSYSSGITGDEEASWVGLGWNLSVGQINRGMRGLPDEFNGDIVKVKKDAMPNVTVGVGAKLVPGAEIVGLNTQDIISLSAGVKLYSNTYKGYGYTSDLGIGASFGIGGPMTANIGLDFSNDRFEGASVSPSVGLGMKQKDGDNTVSGGLNLGMNYNSNMGITGFSLSASVTKSKLKEENSKFIEDERGKLTNDEEQKGYEANTYSRSSVGASSSISFAGAQSPSVHDRTVNSGINLSFKPGAGFFGMYAYAIDFQGFYNMEMLKNRGATQYLKSYGFQNFASAESQISEDGDTDQPFLSDHNYEKEAMIHKNLEHLPIPIGTYDIYSVSGQGIGAQIKPYHSNIGILPEPQRFSRGGTGSLGLEGFAHFGFSVYASFNKDKSGMWTSDNGIEEKYKYNVTKTDVNDVYFEPTYFQSYGESRPYEAENLNDILVDFQPTRIGIMNKNPRDFSTTKILYKDKGAGINNYANSSVERVNRKTLVQGYTMEQLTNQMVLPHFKVKYTKNVSTSHNVLTHTEQINRSSRPGHHYGGFEGLSPEGTRYIYGLPAYNEKTIETAFSAEKWTSPYPGFLVDAPSKNKELDYKVYEKTLDKKEFPAYAHAYLLTSVLGQDYIDVKNDGVTDDDLGYWVKMGYVNTSDKNNPYKWRAPYRGANYVEGLMSKNADDMGSFHYGERENWYVSTIETKSHVAEFYISSREDAMGARNQIVSLGESIHADSLAKSYKLDSIKLFTKQERYQEGDINHNAIAIKTVYLEYAGYLGKYEGTKEMCRMNNGLFNTPQGRGKLTLMSVWFKNRDNARGQLNPYVFNYHANDPDENPDYHPYANDRWGNYQPDHPQYPNQYYPYVRQFDGKAVLDKRAAVWSLKEITLPTGALIQVDYEADDYAYVQNKKAMQMYQLDNPDESWPLLRSESDRIHFKLAEPVPSGLSTQEQKQLLSEYFDNTGQVYFKVKSDMINLGDHFEYISGYAEVLDYGLVNSTTAYVQLKRINTKAGNIHPFAVAAWNYLQMSRPEIMTGNEPLKIGDPENSSGKEKMAEIVGVATNFLTLFSDLRSFYKRANEKGFGLNIQWEHSYIRLNNVTGYKYGGGNRVKSVKLIHKFQGVTDTSGVTYQYTTTENGQTISSGVASYEPMIGGDETALRKASFFDKAMALNTSVKSYTELPIQETYYPAPSIGYSKVEVKSLNTAKVLSAELPVYIPTTGVSVKEFYTHKDFPVFMSATKLESKESLRTFKSTPPITIPFIGSIGWDKIAASQGYYVELNDMSGKEKSTHNYRISSEGTIDYAAPVSYTKNFFYANDTVINNQTSKKLNNYIPTTDGYLKAIQNKYLGIDYEIYNGVRTSRSFSLASGLRPNLEPFVFFVVVGAIPSTQENARETHLAVTNKIVHRFGVPYGVEEYSEGSHKFVKNEVYDALTAQPVLTSFTDEFQDTIYQYTIPAYWMYENMGGAYQNAGVRFKGKYVSMTADGSYYIFSLTEDNGIDRLTNGDEILIEEKKAYITKVNKTDKEIWVQLAASQSGLAVNQETPPLEIQVIRSGYKNMLQVPAGSVLSKVNPLKSIDDVVCP